MLSRQETAEAWALGGMGLVKGIFNEVIKPSLREHPAIVGWASIGAFVAAWDLISRETLSQGVDVALESHKLLTTAAIGYTACHLLNVLPEQVDAFHGIGQIVRPVK